MAALTIAACAAELRMTRKQLSYQIARGMPVLRRGRRGRGDSTLLDPAAVRAWLHQDEADAGHHQLARELTRSIAEGLYLQLCAASGPHKRLMAASLVATFHATVAVMRARLRLAPLDDADTPECIRKMDKIKFI